MKITPMVGNDNTMFLEDIDRREMNFINFSGKDSRGFGKKNPTFGVRLTEEEAAYLSDLGWPVSYSKPKEDHPEWESRPYIVVTLYENNKNLKVVVITDGKQKRQSNDNLEALDSLRIGSISCQINKFPWERNGMSGVKIASNLVYITALKNYLAEKYADYPDVDEDETEAQDLDITSDPLPF